MKFVRRADSVRPLFRKGRAGQGMTETMRWLGRVAGCFLLWGEVAGAALPSEGFAPLVEKVLPAVVDITTRSEGGSPLDLQGLSVEDLLREHLERQFQGPGDGDRGEPARKMAAGSGFVIESGDDTAFVVTNFHVIDGAEEIYVHLPGDEPGVDHGGDDGKAPQATARGKKKPVSGSVDGRKGLVAEVVGKDRRTDIALLKIRVPHALPVLGMADSTKVRTGDVVLSIGNPFGFGSTVTAGIVSRRARDISDQTRSTGVGDYVREYIQTDASVNSGNSGGPLINTAGQVVGVNAIICSVSGGNLGIAFAIPSNTVQKTVEQLRKHGRARRGWLGVVVQKVGPELAESTGLARPRGVAVSSVYPKGPAAEAGIQEGEIILAINGADVRDVRDVPYLVGELPVGQPVDVRVWRHEKEVTLRVTLGDYEEAEEKGVIQTPWSRQNLSKNRTGSAQKNMLGLSVQDISPKARQYYGLAEDLKGVLVVRVQKGSAAMVQGVQPGDVITRMDREPVSSVEDFAACLSKARTAGRKSVVLIVHTSGDAARIVVLKLGDASRKAVPEGSED